LLGKYTDKHPEVRRTRQLIAKLEADLRNNPGSGTATKDSISRVPLDPEIQQLKFQIKGIDLNIKKLKNDQKKVLASIKQYEKWIEKTPVREAQWNALTRDYNELRRNYDYLVSQNLQAASVEHLERKQKGSKFKIIDPARFPDKPFKPDFKKMLLLALGAGGGLGIGLTLVLDFVDTSFKDIGEIESQLGVKVISAVPYIELVEEEKKKRFLTMLSGILFFLYTLLLIGIMIFLHLHGKIIV